MPKQKRPNLIERAQRYLFSSAVLVFVVGFWIWQANAQPSAIGQPVSQSTTQAEVIEVLETGQVDLGGSIQTYQILRVQPIDGPYQDQSFQIDIGRRQLRAPGPLLQPGDEVMVTISAAPDGTAQAFFVDHVRTSALAWLLVIFIVFTLIISRRKGLQSLIAMAFSLTVILAYILPNILAGKDPVLISVIGSFVILSVSLYTVYGWTIKTHAAVLGTLLALVLTGVLASVFVTFTRLTGFSSEEAMFLSQQPNSIVNFRGLTLGGIIIGSLGVLDDLVITQASVIFELYLLDPKQRLRDLYRRGMRVGQDHVAATVNTLVLAYTGAALPLLLLVSSNGHDWLNFINREFVAEEIVRTLVGSLGLISAVPITTALAALVATNMSNFGGARRFLGPAVGDVDENVPHHH